MAGKTMTGGRAKVFVDDVLVGLFDSCTWGSNIGAEPIYTLGRYGAQEITPTSYEPVTVQCSGFRVISEGVHILPKFPKLQDILNLETVRLDVTDRQTGEKMATITGCIPITENQGVQARATSRIQVTYMGLKVTDEDGDQDEAGAVVF